MYFCLVLVESKWKLSIYPVIYRSMKKHLILFLILVSVLGSRAQDWKLFQIGEKYNYGMQNMPFYSSIWIDSTAYINNDSVYYFNKVLKKVKEGNNWQWPYFYLNDQSQFFLSNLIFGSGKDLLFKETDTNKFIINTSAGLDDQWVFDSLKNITATMVSSGLENLFGEIDSVKLIALSNNDTIIISKHHSVLKFPLFNSLHQHVVLSGIEGRNLGVQVPEFKDFYDFSPGDVFCYKKFNTGGTGRQSYTQFEKRTIKSKEIKNDSIIYHCDYKMKGIIYDLLRFPVYDTIYLLRADTAFVYVDNSNHFLNKYPNQTLNNGIQCQTLKPVSVGIDTTWNTIIKKITSNSFYEDPSRGDTVIEFASPMGCTQYRESEAHGVKRGLIYYDYYYASIGDVSQARYRGVNLMGSKTNEQQHGIIYDDSFFRKNFMGVQNTERIFKIYPNPVSDILTIEMNVTDQTQLFISNLNGQVIICQLINSDKTAIDVSDLVRGIYFIKVLSGKLVSIQKLIKE